jgi:hypothetical protein
MAPRQARKAFFRWKGKAAERVSASGEARSRLVVDLAEQSAGSLSTFSPCNGRYVIAPIVDGRIEVVNGIED